MERIATVKFIASKKSQTRGGMSVIVKYCSQDRKTVWNDKKLVSGINLVPQSSFSEMMNTKNQYSKIGGRMFYHLIQSFHSDESITPEMTHEIGLKLANEIFKGYEVKVATHSDTEHIQNHFVVNSVSFENGLKYHSDKDEIQRIRDYSYKLCKDYMENEGYEVKWTDTRKNITYTTPNGMKCRDNKLHELKYIKKNMEYEFINRKEIIRRIKKPVQDESAENREYSAVRFSNTEQLGSSDKSSGQPDRDGGKSFSGSYEQENYDRLSQQILEINSDQIEKLKAILKNYQTTMSKTSEECSENLKQTVTDITSQVGIRNEEYSKNFCKMKEHQQKVMKWLVAIAFLPTVIQVVWFLIQHILLQG